MANEVIIINGQENTEGTATPPVNTILGTTERAIDATGLQKVSQDLSLFHSLFTYDVTPYLWFVEEDDIEILNTASTRLTVTGGFMTVTSGATAGNKAEAHSRRHPRYQPDRGTRWSSAVAFVGANSDGILMAGLKAKEQTGVYLKTKGDGELYACISNDSVETYEEAIDFPWVVDITKGNHYSIQLGVGTIKFFCLSVVSGVSEVIHEITPAVTQSNFLVIDNLALPASFYAENVTEEVTLRTGYVDITSEGGGPEREQYGEALTTKIVSSGDGIIAIRSPNLIHGKINTRDLSLARITTASDKKATVKAYRTRDPSAITGGTWTALGAGSFVEANDTMTSVNLGLMSLFATFKIAAGGENVRTNPSTGVIDFYGIHGDYMVLVCDDGAIATIDAAIEWGEEI